MSDKKNTLLETVRKIAGTKQIHESIIAAEQFVEPAPAAKPKMSQEVMEMRKAAGLPLVEGWDDGDDDEDPDVKIASSDKRQQAFEKKAKKDIAKVDADKDMSKLAKGSKDEDEKEEKSAPAPAAAKDAAKDVEEKPKASRGSFSSIVKPLLARGASTSDIRAALTKAGVEVKHLHSRLHGLRKNIKEGFVLVHPQMPSFVLAENAMMNQYQWISEKDDSTTLAPLLFTTEAAAEKVIKYVREFKNQSCILTPISFKED